MRRTVLGSLALLWVLAAPSARADDPPADAPDFARSGFYLGGSATYGFNLLESAFDDVLFDDVDVGDTWGFDPRVGYRALRWLAVEAQYEYLRNFGVTFAGAHLADLNAQTITANVRFIAPLRRFQPYLRIGAGATIFDLDDNIVPGLRVDHSGFSGRIGVGLDVYATENLVIAVGADSVLSAAQVEDTVLDGGSESLSYIAVHMGIDLRF